MSQQGQGIGDIINKILPTREDFPPKVRSVIKKYNDKKITNITIGRQPVQSAVTNLLNVISLGQLRKKEKELGYDNLYHLFMLVDLNDGTCLLVEKNSVVNMKKVDKSYGGNDKINIPVNKDITFGEFIDKAVKGVGKSIYLYDSINNNCQIFINNLLRYSGLGTGEATKFILQDIEAVLSTSPKYTSIIAKLATEASAKVDRLIQGAGKNKKIHRAGTICRF
jgi:hypothetical protein